MNERGHYGSNGSYGRPSWGAPYRAHVGAEQAAPTPWWKIALGAALIYGVAYLALRPTLKEYEQTLRRAEEHAREVGIKPGMTQAEQDRAWDAYYAKHGLKLEDGELVRVRPASH